MKRSDEIRLRLSEIAERRATLDGKPELSEEERAELDKLSREYAERQAKLRAAMRDEDAAESRAASDGEGAERQALMREVRCARYLAAAVESRGVDGREAELNAALGLAVAGVMPWAALDPGEAREARADAATSAPATGTPQTQDAILGRVFAGSVADFLRIGPRMAGPGTASFPVFSDGASGSFVAPGAAQDAEAATFTPVICTPHRAAVRYLWRMEDAALLAGMEAALRPDLSLGLANRIDAEILSGDGTGAHLSGFFDSAGGPLDAPAAATGAAADFDAATATLRGQVDGLYAEDEGALRLLVGSAWYQHAGTLYRATDGDVSANDYLRTRSGGYRVSAHVPGPDASARKNAPGLVVRGMDNPAVLVTWEGVRLIRDEISGAASGEVALTAVALVDFAVRRKAQYRFVRLATA